MDMELFGRVLWRSRVLVLAGFLAACVLAVLAMARVAIVNGFPTLVYRDPVVYQSTVQMLVTQQGLSEEPSTDPRFAALAALYSQLIMGNAELQRVFGSGKRPLYENVLAAPMPAPDSQPGFLPIIQITGIGPSPDKAKLYADRAAITFSSDLAKRQSQSHVAISQRVILDRVAGPLRPSIYLPRKKTRAIFVFIFVLMLTIAAAFVRQNLRDRRIAGEEADGPDGRAEPVRQNVRTPRIAGVEADGPDGRAEPARKKVRIRRMAGADAPNGRAEHVASDESDAAVARDK